MSDETKLTTKKATTKKTAPKKDDGKLTKAQLSKVEKVIDELKTTVHERVPAKHAWRRHYKQALDDLLEALK